MHPAIQNAIQEIDAAMFSGDAFINGENIQKLQEYLDRWNRGLNEHRATLKEIIMDNEEEDIFGDDSRMFPSEIQN
jgi:hypothetical protein